MKSRLSDISVIIMAKTDLFGWLENDNLQNRETFFKKALASDIRNLIYKFS